MRTVLLRFENNRLFTEPEAWLLFQIGAIAEACGWTLLIAGILVTQYSGNRFAVLLAGQIHGMLFLGYALAALGLYPNLGWSRKRAIVGILASVPPYGSLLFEQYASHIRRREHFVYCHRSVLLTILRDKVKVLV